MRRRMLSPDFFTDPDIVALDFAGRLFYQGLWCVADDSGVFDPNPLALKMKIFPGDNLDIEVILGYYEMLKSINKVMEFNANGKVYAWIKNFHKHQKLDRPSPPSLPLPEWIVWHGEDEFGKERHRWHYEVLPVAISTTTPLDDNSPSVRRQVGEQDTIEVKLREEKLKEVKLREEERESTNEASAAEPPVATLENLYSQYHPDQQKVIDDYWDLIRFTRKSAKLSGNIKITEMEYWSRYPPDMVIQALNIHRQKYQTKDERYTRGIIRGLKREKEREVRVNAADRPNTASNTGADPPEHKKSKYPTLRVIDGKEFFG